MTKPLLPLLLIPLLAACVAQPQRPDESAQIRAEAGAALAHMDTDAKVLEPADQHVDRDLWGRIRDGFALPVSSDARTVSERTWYARHPQFMARTAERAQPYLHFIVEEVERRGIPTEIALLPIVESAFQPFAYSHGRAAGLWQFIPGTGRRYGLKQNWWYDGRRDVVASTRAALDYLESLNKEFDGDWLLALAAYNSGEGNVHKAIRKNLKLGKPTDFWNLDLPRETEGYVPKLLAIRDLVAAPEMHDLALAEIPDEPVFTLVDIGSQIDLALAADMAEISLEELYRYNPGFNRWATDPEGPHTLVIPLDKADSFARALEQQPADQRIQWQRHRIGNGEALSTIARNYSTTVEVLKSVNHLRGNAIRAGKYLIIPVAARTPQAYALSQENRLKRTQNREREGTKVTYTVKAGDTLWDITRKFGINSTRKLAAWNSMAPRDHLAPGQKLVLWVPDQAKAAAAPAIARATAPAAAQRTIRYTVRNGDSLARIAKRFRVSIAEIKRWNSTTLADNRYLQPGQNLTLHVDVTRQNGG